MKCLRILIVSLSLLFVWLGCYSQNDWKVRHITVDNGLLNGNVNQITQDTYGFIWMATENGLIRYDGVDYKIFQAESDDVQQISHNFVNAVSASCPEYVWIGTMSGVDRLTVETGDISHFYFYNELGNHHMKPALRVCPVSHGCFVQSDDRSVYFCSLEHDTIQKIVYAGFDPSTFVSAMAVVDDETIVVGNKSGQLFLLSQDGVVTVLSSFSSAITDVILLSHETLCVCQESGTVTILDKKKEIASYTLQNVADTYISSVAKIQDDILALGTRSQGLFFLNTQVGAIQSAPVNLLTNNCSSVLSDSFGNIWVAHPFGGVSLMLSQSIDFIEDKSCSFLKNQKVLSVVSAGKYVFVATDGGGLFIYDTIIKQYRQYTYRSGFQGLPFDDVITSLFVDDEKVWIGTYSHGIFAFSTRTGQLVSVKQLSACPEKNIAVLFVDSKKNVWIGTYESGVFVYNQETGLFDRHYTGYENDGNLNISCNGSTYFLEDKDNSVWVCSYYGITKVASSGNTIIYRYEDYPGMRSSVVTTAALGADNVVYFGSLQGLSYYDSKHDTIVAIQNKQAAHKLTVCSIIPQEDSTLIVVTPKQVYIYDNKRDTYHFVITIPQGEFQRNSYSVWGGNLRLGSDKGLCLLHTPISIERETVHTLKLTDLLVEGLSVFSPLSPYSCQRDSSVFKITLPHYEKNIVFKFSEFVFDDARPQNYVYQLHGFDEDSLLLYNQNSISYSNLQGGDYLFTIRNVNDLGPEIVEVQVTIEKAFWERTIFYVFLFFIVAGLISIIFITRMRKIIRMRNRLQRQIEIRIKDLKEKALQIQLQNEQIRLQRDAANRMRSESEQQKQSLEKRHSLLMTKLQKDDDFIRDLKQRSIAVNREKITMKRQVDLYENNVQEVVFKVAVPSGKIEYVSPLVSVLTGYSDEDFYEGVVTLPTVFLDETPDFLVNYRRLINEGKFPQEVRYSVKTKDGKQRQIYQTARYETNLKGSIIALELVMMDTSHNIRTEDAVFMPEKNDLVENYLVEATEEIEGNNWQQKTVLVVDDDDESYNLICEYLSSTQIQILRLTEGEGVAEYYKQKRDAVDIIILTVQLPKKNGFLVTQEIRTFDKEVPIIAQMAYWNYEAKIQCFDAGCNTYISKPYKANDLQQIMLKYIDSESKN